MNRKQDNLTLIIKNHARLLLCLANGAVFVTRLLTLTGLPRVLCVIRAFGSFAAIVLTVLTIFAADISAADTGRIVFTSVQEIYSMNADGSGMRLLFTGGSNPRYSPDGTKIAFWRDNAVWLANADGSGARFVAPAGPLAPFRMLGLTWSPDGNRIAFTCDVGICAVNVDGTNRTTISRDIRDNAPDWSPDGTKFVFSKRPYAACRSPENHECWPDIYVMDVDGGNQTLLYFHGPPDFFSFLYVYNPVWSPDGTKIAFGSVFFDFVEIYVINPDGSNLTYVTGGDDYKGIGIPAYDPTWSPDGTKIAFAGDLTPGNALITDIFVVNLDGTDLRNISRTDTVYERHPDWGTLPSASVSISGRVTTPDGRGLRNATVWMIDQQGVRRTATTSSFGYYTFDNVRSGETYLIGVSSRRYRFSSRELLVTNDLTDVDFVGQE